MGAKVPIPSGHPPTDPVAVDRVGLWPSDHAGVVLELRGL